MKSTLKRKRNLINSLNCMNNDSTRYRFRTDKLLLKKGGQTARHGSHRWL